MKITPPPAATFASVFKRAVVLLAAAISLSPRARAQVVSNIFSFDGLDGAMPTLQFFNPAEGKFYGTARFGANTNSTASNGLGTLFKVNTSGVIETIFEFDDASNRGGNPVALARAADGTIYGMASGQYSEDATNYGTIFKVVGNSVQTLFQRTSFDTHGWVPANLPAKTFLVGSDGVLYGMLGTYVDGSTTAGAIFGMGTNDMAPKYMMNFDDAQNSYPQALVEVVTSGTNHLYGLTANEATNSTNFGAIFRVSADTNAGDFANIFSFDGNNGWSPRSLMQGPDGKLYGTAKADDTNPSGLNGFSIIFRLATNGTGFTTLAKFRKTNSVGVFPTDLYIGVISNGFIYGTFNAIRDTNGGLVAPSGVFKVAIDGSGFTVLRNIDTAGDANATALLSGPAAKLYGSSDLGGTDELGSIFTLSPVLDRIPPTLRVTVPSTGSVSTQAQRLVLRGTASDNVSPARVQFRIKPPGGRYGNWSTLNLAAGSATTKAWSRTVALSRRGPWAVQIRAFDSADNASAIRTITILRR